MRSKILLASVLLLVGLGVAASQLTEWNTFHLQGHEEVPAVSTAASAEFNVRILNAPEGGPPDNRARIEYDLFYQNLQAPITQSHIHFGQEHVNGGISVWLCGTAALPGPPGTQACPPSPGVVRGTLRASDVIGPAGQGIAAGEFAELIRAMRAGVTYANIHTTQFPGGEIRAQLRFAPEPNGTDR